jgi:hypothetical protein
VQTHQQALHARSMGATNTFPPNIHIEVSHEKSCVDLIALVQRKEENSLFAAIDYMKDQEIIMEKHPHRHRWLFVFLVCSRVKV